MMEFITVCSECVWCCWVIGVEILNDYEFDLSIDAVLCKNSNVGHWILWIYSLSDQSLNEN